MRRVVVTGMGIVLIPWKCGLVEEVLIAYFSGNLEDPRFSLPGVGNGSTVQIRDNRVEGREAP